MKKLTSLLLALVLVCALVGCGTDANQEDPADGSSQTDTETSSNTEDGDNSEEDGSVEDESTPEDGSDEEEEPSADADVKSEGVMTYAEYDAAAVDTEVVIEAYVQGKQSWWDNKATVYTQDADGAYFLYEMACSEEDYAKLVPGTKIKVTGYKSEWSGEVEIIDATFEIEEGSYIAEAEDVTALLGSDDLVSHQNKFVSFKGMTVESQGQDEDGNEIAFLYKWDGSGQDGDDLYFNVSLDGVTYTFTVESYLCDNTTDVYAAVKALNVGDKIDMEGFLYWYNGVNPHITSVTPAE
ncbi:MAG: hypothetical protein HDR26_00925 [Lachnospiraceae bacterium]|nr:hypothetical protein [Lachnospiraceae bacterium]